MGLNNGNKIAYVSIGFIAGWAFRKASIIGALIIGGFIGASIVQGVFIYKQKQSTQENRNVN